MDLPQDFSLEQMGILVRGVVMPGAIIAMARDSGKQGTSSEFRALADGIDKSIREHAANPFFVALASDYGRSETGRLLAQLEGNAQPARFADTKMVGLSRAAQLADLLDEKGTPDQAAAVKQAVLSICNRVAEAGKENSLWGMGGTRVSVEESGLITELSRAMRVL